MSLILSTDYIDEMLRAYIKYEEYPFINHSLALIRGVAYRILISCRQMQVECLDP